MTSLPTHGGRLDIGEKDKRAGDVQDSSWVSGRLSWEVVSFTEIRNAAHSGEEDDAFSF